MAIKAGNLKTCHLEERKEGISNETQLPIDFYFKLRSPKEDYSLCSADSGGKKTFKGDISNVYEESMVNREADVTADWLESIGGPDLAEYVF